MSDLLPDGEYLVVVGNAQYLDTGIGAGSVQLWGTVVGNSYDGRHISTKLGMYSDDYLAMLVFDQWMGALGIKTKDWLREMRITGGLKDTMSQLAGRRAIFVMGHQKYPVGKRPKRYQNYVLEIKAPIAGVE